MADYNALNPTAPATSLALPRYDAKGALRADGGASLTYLYRTSGGTLASATSLPLPAGGVLLRTVSR